MTTPFFSVVLCFYNARNYIEEALSSILSQSFRDFEIILIDDGSTDDSYKIIEKLCLEDERIRYFRKENSGLTDSLNFAINLARGEFMVRHDADDISSRHRLETIRKNIKPNIDFYFSKTQEFGDSGRIFPSYRYRYGFCKSVMKFGNFIAHGSIALRMSVSKKLLYDTSWKYAQDYELYTRLISLGYKGLFINEILYHLRVSQGSISANKRDEQLLLCKMAIKKNFGISTNFIACTTGPQKPLLVLSRELLILASITKQLIRKWLRHSN